MITDTHLMKMEMKSHQTLLISRNIIHIYFSVCSNGIMPVFWSSMNLMLYFSFFDSL